MALLNTMMVGSEQFFNGAPRLTRSTVIVGTPGTASQYAKDVVTFLNWAAEPEHDERKKIGVQAVILLSALTAISLYTKRFKWTSIKTRKIGESFTLSLYFCGKTVLTIGRHPGSLHTAQTQALDAPFVIKPFTVHLCKPA
jgi:hypothetical protein